MRTRGFPPYGYPQFGFFYGALNTDKKEMQYAFVSLQFLQFLTKTLITSLLHNKFN
jgi:hypothetical protein